MKRVRLLPAVFLLGVVGVTPTHAEEVITGRWAEDAAACATSGVGRSPLIVTAYGLRWRDDVCRIERVYKTGDTFHLQASCMGDNGARQIPVSLRPHGNRLQVRWDRKASGDMRRCS